VKRNYTVVAGAIALFALLSFGVQYPRALGASASCSSPANILNPVEPDIPESVAKAHPNVSVELNVTVDASGQPSAIEVVKATGNKTIDAAVARAAQHSTYRPEMQNCKAVSGGKYLFRADIGP
jgi:TonB family protein